MRPLKTIFLLTMITLVAACSSPAFKGDVTRFHADIPPANGAKVNVIPADSALSGGLEFGTYAEMLGQHLARSGYTAAAGEEPDLVAVMAYAVSNGREKLLNRPRSRIGVGTWGYGHYSSYYWWAYDPFLYDQNELYATTVYTATLKVTLRYPEDADGKPGDVLFEGVVESESRKKHLPKLMPYMLEAMFQDFPGINGETRKIVIEPPEEK